MSSLRPTTQRLLSTFKKVKKNYCYAAKQGLAKQIRSVRNTHGRKVNLQGLLGGKH